MGVYYQRFIIPRDNTVRPEPDRIVALIGAWVEKGFIVRPECGQAQGSKKSNRRRSETGARFQTSSLIGDVFRQQQVPQPRKGFWARLFGEAQKVRRPDPMISFSIPPVGESLSALAQPWTLIRWDGNPNATYPMQTVSGDDYEEPHSLTIELSDDFVNPHTDLYGGTARQIDPHCRCGCDLEYVAILEHVLGWTETQKIRRICPACGLVFQPQDQIAEIVDGNTGAMSPQPGGLCNRFAIVINFGKSIPSYVRGPKSNELFPTSPKTTPVFLDLCSDALGIELSEFSYYS
jgi:hypothetical protein